MTIKQEIMATVDDAVTDFLDYNRREDEDLPRGAIEDALNTGEITVDEIVERFKEQIDRGIK